MEILIKEICQRTFFFQGESYQSRPTNHSEIKIVNPQLAPSGVDGVEAIDMTPFA